MRPVFPVARWLGLLWLLAWVPAYWRHYGPAVFLNLCDIAVLLTILGLWLGSPRLLSMQALSSLVVDGAWIVDLVVRAAFGRHLIGGTEYMWDPKYPMWLRLLSLFHVWLPLTLLWALRRTGYDRRALPLQAALAALVVFASRAIGPEANSNFAFRDPFFDRAWGPWPLHVTVIVAGLVVVYALTHLALRKAFPSPEHQERRPEVSVSPE